MVSVFRLLLLCGVFIIGTISSYASSKSYHILSGFVENAGQFKNQNLQKNDEIKFQLRTQNMLVQLKRNGFNYQIRGNNEWQRIEVIFEACNWSEPKAMELLPGELFYSSSYDIGQKYAAHQYQKVYYKNLYDGIDLECIASKQEGTDVEFKYNFIIHPGANPKQILMKINGAPKTWVDESGSLCMQTISGEIKDRMPISYELNKKGDFHKKVSAVFEEINDNQFGILLGEYNPKNTLVVDPILWATYLGGFNYDVLRKLVVDTLGNSYCMGQTYSVNSISTTGAYQTSLSGNTDAFIAKFSPTGTLIWATYFGGANDEVGYALALSKKQELIIVGSTRSTSGIASTGAYQTIIAGEGDGFVAKFSSNGSLIWSTYLGWSGNESILNVCVDEKDDDINIIGNSTSASVGVFSGVYATSNMGVQDVVLAKLSSSGLVKWVSLFGGALNDFGVSIKTDKLGNLYFNGYTFSTTGLATSGAWRTNNSGSTIDAFISIFDSTGQLVRSTFYGGIRQDNFTGLDLDTAGNIYAVGYTNSMDSISTPGSFQENFYGILSSYDMMLIKFNSQLRPIWGTYIGGKGNDFLYDVSVSRNGYIVCGGNTNSDSLATLDANQVYLTTLNYQAAYVAVFSPDGNRHYASYFTGNTATYVQSVATDMYNQIYITGSTNSSIFITTPGAHQTSYGGATDAYLLKLQISYPSVNLPLSNNVLSASQQTCGATQPGIINGSSPSGGNGSFTYLWLHSTTGSTGIFSPAPGVNTGKDYQPGTANPQTWYKRWVYSGTDSLESNVILIDLNAIVKADFSVNKMIQCHRTNEFIFTDNSQSSETYTRYWDFDNGSFGSNQIETQSFVYGTKNYFDVKLRIETSGGCKDSLSKRVFLIGHPDTNSISGLTDVKLFDTATYSVPATTGSIYMWRFSNGIGYSLGNAITLKWTKVGLDTLYLVEQSSGGCLSDTMRLPISIRSGVGLDNLQQMGFNVYPNPANQQVYIESKNLPSYSWSLTNALGELVLVQTEEKGTRILDINNLTNGIYFLQITNDLGQINVSKLVVQH